MWMDHPRARRWGRAKDDDGVVSHLGLSEGVTVGGCYALFSDFSVLILNQDGDQKSFEILPTEFDIPIALPSELQGGTPADNAKILRDVLAGQSGPQRDIVELNAGAAIWVAGATSDLAGGVDLARVSIDSGGAQQKLAELIRATNDDIDERDVAREANPADSDGPAT